MTRKKYEELQRRLAADIEDARKALNTARIRYDQLCEESRNLRLDWRDQQEGQQP